jgi:hypothetical protein
MARGSKKSYTSKQRRQASHIEDSAKKSGKSAKTAKRIAYATVNKQDGARNATCRRAARADAKAASAS